MHTTTLLAGIPEPHAPILQQLDLLRRAGHDPARGDVAAFVLRCPFHDDRDPSAKVTIKSNGGVWFWCPVCQHRGAAEREVIREHYGGTWADWSPPRAGSGGSASPPFTFAGDCLATNFGIGVRHAVLMQRADWVDELQELGFTVEALRALRVGHVGVSARHGWHFRREADYLMFPYCIPGRGYVGAGLSLPVSARATSEASPKVTWGRSGLAMEHGGPDPLGPPVALVEGPRTALAMTSCGIPAIAMPTAQFVLGAAMKTWLRRYAATGVFVVPDHDPGGRKAAAEWARALRSNLRGEDGHLVKGGVSDVRLVDLCPKRNDKTDAADLLAEEGREALRERVLTAWSETRPLAPVTSGRPPKATEAAHALLQRELRGGAHVPTNVIEYKARAMNISKRTMDRARKTMDVRWKKTRSGTVLFLETEPLV